MPKAFLKFPVVLLWTLKCFVCRYEPPYPVRGFVSLSLKIHFFKIVYMSVCLSGDVCLVVSVSGRVEEGVGSLGTEML